MTNKRYVLVAGDSVVDIIVFNDAYSQYERWAEGFSSPNITFKNVSANENAIIGSTYADGVFTKYSEPAIPVDAFTGRYAALADNKIFYLKFADDGQLKDFYDINWENISNVVEINEDEDVSFLSKWAGPGFIN